MKIISNNEQKTYELGYKLGTLLKRGDVVCLTGDLGAGKTTISKAIAKGLGVDECVTSPTFTIIHEYMGHIPLYHFDVYRIGEIEEMEDLGYEEYFYGEGVCLIEWASQIEDLIPKEHLWMHIKRIDENTREIEMTGNGQHFHEVIEELKRI
ncbi:tRNA (adenosine(37)-N6)-threonylcarbamoyltransferase complex ATPase subunit type 1 TsaE [Crassaminicella profunda]|uniref:tRNA (adenosine(37)-N6)-threonylcarbamoyltransferase complex ATPase subunit type 1 TsaE n=1 Tax=Crassaminicella profunda TaxID=1286698 RepID=UPI001CA60D22|nr:tRNA (adenosine(37)-N6)-threonylcarbamoyltransferase complex ATPase subunit type 1 TsaE [Crassaminicella profunda]QZY54268.1 tRNA (adenosine(37)-N6)-threonylcarbamoyltransferase complex ATPase subunit type 1 TsaE [Crassaminicella profunda]